MISEERLRQAANEAGRALSESLPDPEDCQHTFSPEFERKMERLLRRSRYMGLRQGLQRAACFFLALLCSGGVWLSVDAEAREAFFGWVSERLGMEQHFFFQGENSAVDLVRYTLSEIPMGYEPYDFYDNDAGFVSNVYVGPNEDLLAFEYIIGDSTEMYLNLNDVGDLVPVFVNGELAEFYSSEQEDISNVLIWCDQETGTLLYLSGYFEEGDLIRMAESVVKEKT